MDSKISDWRPGPTVCRCCLSEGCYKDISTEYFWMGKTEIYADMLSETFNLSISYSQSGGPNSNSRLICEPCISRLRDASEFKRQVQECEKTFINHLDAGAVGEPSTASMEIETPMLDVVKGVKLEEVKLEKQYSDDEFDCRDFGDEDDDDDLDDQPLTTFATKVPKKESVDLLDLLDNTQITVKRKSKTKDPEQSKKPKLVRKATATVKAKASVSAKKVEVNKPVEKKKKDDELVKRTENDVLEAKRNKMLTGRVELGAIINPVKNNAVHILRQTTVYPFNFKENKYQCALCRKDFEDPELFRVHVDTNHQKNDRAIILSKVKKQFRIDITNMKCRVCARPFNDLKLIVKHLKDDHGFKVDLAESLGLVPVRLDKNRFVCVVCDKKYTGFKALSAHTGTHFQRSVCHICGQRFETKSGVQSHVYRTHLIACIVCKKKFETAKERIEHVRSSNAKCFPFKCNRCEKRFLVWEQREDHCVNDHGTQRIEFPCKDCGEVFQHRCKLYFHFKMAHTDDTKCTECNRVFGWRKQLEEHMLVHSGVKPFQCDVCSKTFTRKKNYQRHVIIHDDSKKLRCTHCNRLFVAKHRLVSHMKLRHPDVCNDEVADADKRK